MYNTCILIKITCTCYIMSTGDFNMPILMDEVNCTGAEHYLSDCPFDGWNTHDCSHYEDAGVICQGIP